QASAKGYGYRKGAPHPTADGSIELLPKSLGVLFKTTELEALRLSEVPVRSLCERRGSHNHQLAGDHAVYILKEGQPFPVVTAAREKVRRDHVGVWLFRRLGVSKDRFAFRSDQKAVSAMSKIQRSSADAVTG